MARAPHCRLLREEDVLSADVVLDHSSVNEWADGKVSAGTGQTEVSLQLAGIDGHQLTITSPDLEPAHVRDARLSA